jgi:hypothetical protein
VRLDYASDDRQTQAGTKTCPSGVETPEPVKCTRSIRRGHPFALIDDRQDGNIIVALDLHADLR